MRHLLLLVLLNRNVWEVGTAPFATFRRKTTDDSRAIVASTSDSDPPTSAMKKTRISVDGSDSFEAQPTAEIKLRISQFLDDIGLRSVPADLLRKVVELHERSRKPFRCSKTGEALSFSNDNVSATKARAFDRKMRRNRRFVTHRRKWAFTDLTWRLSDPFGLFESSSDCDVVHDVLAEAFNLWSSGSNGALKLIDISNEPSQGIADLEIYFALLDHGDHEPFDGVGGIVAHSGYPMEGKVHFDASEQWTVGGKRGIDFRYVALHEVGHALGLRHSQFNDSIMYPVYLQNPADLGLSDDDVAGIQYLYASPVPAPDALAPPHPAERNAESANAIHSGARWRRENLPKKQKTA